MSRRGKTQTVPETYSNDWIEKIDGRYAIAKVVNDRLQALESDLGGRAALSYQQRSLCKRAIWMEAIIEQSEAKLARGEEVNQGALTQAVNSLIGLLKTLGLHRVERDVPSLNDYLKQKHEGSV
ncbi:MAG: hypothetical protein KZQ85_14740 [Candidatus Thiodiazotropha sp. (ex Myrtea sp. 'scaly one' KF741663)]|nr:hypothetical protein [Candidatus Thiodiazotropha sp. (ex Myrtea sp. 'scaly one' KF741663)]